MCDAGNGTGVLRLGYVSVVCLHYTIGVGVHVILRLAIRIFFYLSPKMLQSVRRHSALVLTVTVNL